MSRIVVILALAALVWGSGCQTTGRAPALATAAPVADGEATFQQMLRYTPVLIIAEYPASDGGEHTENASGTGFYYLQSDDGEPRIWLITNRHVVLGESFHDMPQRLVATVRHVTAAGITRRQISLTPEQIRARGRFVPNPRIDLCAIDVTPEISELTATGAVYGILQSSDLASGRDQPLDLGDRVYIAGYPFNLDDGDGHYPMVKTATLSTLWGRPYGGFPGYLVDGNLYTGMSGAPVLLRPGTHGATRPLVLGIFSSTLLVRTPDATGQLTGTTDLHAHRVIYPDYIPLLLRDGIPYTGPTDTRLSEREPR